MAQNSDLRQTKQAESLKESDSNTTVKIETPKGSQGDRKVKIGGKSLAVHYEAAWLPLQKKDKAIAEMFYVHYAVKDASSTGQEARPLTFSFNGGPGAAAAYLHVGALGPDRVAFGKEGQLQPAPGNLTENQETWLPFTDLVFVDPIGTGFSRTIDTEEKAADGDKKTAPGKDAADNKEFFQVNRDLDSLCEFISLFLSRNKAWSRPIFIAGESYGGFRVGKLARKLQERYGVALRGAILVSPALEMSLLNASDYDVAPWVALFPSLVASSFHHGKCALPGKGGDINKAVEVAQKFAAERLAPWLCAGDALGEEAISQICKDMSKLTGLAPEFIRLRNGRISLYQYSRELFRAEGTVCGYYDASLTGDDPFPDRDGFAGPDPTLAGIDRAFGTAINTQLRAKLGVQTSREYHLINFEIFNSWKIDGERHALDSQLGATDDLRFAMALNPHMKVLIVHGLFDLVTPFYSSGRLVELLKLKKDLRKNLKTENYYGGHMFYTWEKSRQQFLKTAVSFYKEALQE